MEIRKCIIDFTDSLIARPSRHLQMVKVQSPPKALLYILYGFILWVIIDLGTAGGFRLSYFSAYGPLLLVFYLGYPLVFAYLIYQCNGSERMLFLGTVIAIILIEAVFTGNPLILSFPQMLVGIPLAICVYVPLTYFPLWIVNREMGKHKVVVVVVSLVVIAVMFLTTFGGRS